MKFRIIYFLVIGALLLGIYLMVTTISTAEQADISIIDFQYELISQKTIGTTEIRTFKLSVTLHNSGDNISDNITVKFRDVELQTNITFSPESTTLESGESKTFIHEEWPTAYQGDVPINISYVPSLPHVPQESYNSGYQVFTIPGDAGGTQATPSFEAALVLLSIALLLSRKIRN
jgi:hypothetical protein